MPLRRWLIGACLGLMAVTGCNCGDDDDNKPPVVTLGDGTIGNIKAVAPGGTAFTAPLDAAPSSDGSTIYFTAHNADGATVFKVAASGGSVTALDKGNLIVAPVGIVVSSDDQMVYIADPGASVSVNGNPDDRGAIWMVPTGGGAPTLVEGTTGYSPRGIALVNENGKDELYFTGTTPDGNIPGVFRIAATGGTAEGIAKGDPFIDPSGIALKTQGDIYVLDSAASNPSVGSARVIQVSSQKASVFASGLRVGFPAGISVAQDDSALLISVLDPAKRTDTILRIDIGAQDQKVYSDGINTYEEAAGMHRAAKAEVYAWVDSSADGSGTVYALTP